MNVTWRYSHNNYIDWKIFWEYNTLFVHNETNAGELTREIVDFKDEYPDKYIDVIAKMEEFQKKLIDNAL